MATSSGCFRTDECRLPLPPPASSRRRDRLTHDIDVWVASASADWDGEALLVATPTDGPTGRNLATARTVRLGLGHTGDVSMIDGAACAGHAVPLVPYLPTPHPGLARGERAARPRADARRPLVGLTPRPGAPRGQGSGAPRAEGKENQRYCSKLVRSSQARPTETAMAAPPNRWRRVSMATRTDPQSPALHVADSHDLIRVHGACANNLRTSASRSRSAG
jgi:hypothetical protein